MNDPYKTLNVSSDATDEEIKRAYRALARKYHPDNYVDNPLADLAQEKMKVINEAYEMIQRQRKSGSYGSGFRASANTYQSRSSSPVMQQVRMAINRGDITTAERLLAGVSDHDGEWNFLMGKVSQRRGWMDEARRYYETACRMEPDNPEFRAAYEYMASGGAGFHPQGFNVFSTDSDICTRLALCWACSTCSGMFGIRGCVC